MHMITGCIQKHLAIKKYVMYMIVDNMIYKTYPNFNHYATLQQLDMIIVLQMHRSINNMSNINISQNWIFNIV